VCASSEIGASLLPLLLPRLLLLLVLLILMLLLILLLPLLLLLLPLPRSWPLPTEKQQEAAQRQR
jgi:hypothetical protein